MKKFGYVLHLLLTPVLNLFRYIGTEIKKPADTHWNEPRKESNYDKFRRECLKNGFPMDGIDYYGGKYTISNSDGDILSMLVSEGKGLIFSGSYKMYEIELD